MTSLAQEHFERTGLLARAVAPRKVAHWLLTEGYFPEQYVLPPCFHVEQFTLKDQPYFNVELDANGRHRFDILPAELLYVFLPKSRLTDRTFGIIEPRIYHDIAWYLCREWPSILERLFSADVRLFSYSFPIPVTERSVGELGPLRPGRMIYEFLAGAEGDLVADAHRFKYKVETDVKNFYPSIYTHSIGWALHTKPIARADHDYALVGNKLDRLFQYANDKCTNGLPIGPVVSDIIAEVLMAAVDAETSRELRERDCSHYLGIRFKDDYKILFTEKDDADRIVRTLQGQMRAYNLTLNEGKTQTKELPEGLFRPGFIEYEPRSLKESTEIPYRTFENTLLTVLKIDAAYPDTGLVDKFLSQLITPDYQLKLKLDKDQTRKAFSLLFLLKERRAKSFPQILAIIELLIDKFQDDTVTVSTMLDEVKSHFVDDPDNLYDDLWICYLLRSRGQDAPRATRIADHPLFESIVCNEQRFYQSADDISLFRPIRTPGNNARLCEHLAIFPKQE